MYHSTYIYFRTKKQNNNNKQRTKHKQKTYNAAKYFQQESQPSDLPLPPSYPIFQAHYEQSPPSLITINNKFNHTQNNTHANQIRVNKKFNKTIQNQRNTNP
jgi:hypothetical protein